MVAVSCRNGDGDLTNQAREQFAAPLATLKQWGYLVTDDDRIGVTRDGLLQIDQLLHEFFLPEHRGARYA